MNIPNLLTVGRFCLVPFVIVMIVQGQWVFAFLIFVVAGVTDALDGFIAKRFNQRTEFGAYLDPLADKALLISIYVTLASRGVLPVWLAILVVSRDLMIVGAVVVSWLLQHPVKISPLFISKANTFAQIAFAALVLGASAFRIEAGEAFELMSFGVGGLTIASAGAYLMLWLRHMSRAAV